MPLAFLTPLEVRAYIVQNKVYNFYITLSEQSHVQFRNNCTLKYSKLVTNAN